MAKKTNEPSQEYLEKKELIELKAKNDEKAHGFRMRELEMIRSTEVVKHENSMERNRIKSAEIRKNLMRKHSGDAYRH